MNVLKHHPDSMMEPLQKRLKCDVSRSCPRGGILVLVPPGRGSQQEEEQQQDQEQNIMSSNVTKLQEVGVDGQILAAVSHSSCFGNSADSAPPASCKNTTTSPATRVHSSCRTTTSTPSCSPPLTSTRVSSSHHTTSFSCLNHDQEQDKDHSLTTDQDEQQCASTTTASEALLLLVGPNKNTKSNYYEEGRHHHHQHQRQEGKQKGRGHEREMERPAINRSEKEISDDEPASMPPSVPEQRNQQERKEAQLALSLLSPIRSPPFKLPPFTEGDKYDATDSLVHGHEGHEHHQEEGERYDGQRRHDDNKKTWTNGASPTSNMDDNGDKNQRPIVMNDKTAHNKSMIDNAASSNHCHVNNSVTEKNESINSQDSIDESIVFLEGPKKFPIKLMAVLSVPKYNSIISWSDGGTSFTIHQPKEFVVQILPKFFRKPSKFHSFIRKLYRWGFTKKASKGKPNQHSSRRAEVADSKTYFHPKFRRGELKLCQTMRSQNKWSALGIAGVIDESSCSYDHDSMQMPFLRTHQHSQQRGYPPYHATITSQDGSTYPDATLRQEQLHQHGNRHHFIGGSATYSNTNPYPSMSSQSKPTFTRNDEVASLNQAPHLLSMHTILVAADGRTLSSQHNVSAGNNSYRGALPVRHHSLSDDQYPIVVAPANHAPLPASQNGQYYLIPVAPASERNDFLYHQQPGSVGVNFTTSNTSNSNLAVADPSHRHHQMVYHVQTPSSPSAAPTNLHHQITSSYQFLNNIERSGSAAAAAYGNNQYHADGDSNFHHQQGPRRQYPPA